MTPELTNIIQLIKAKEFELAYQLLIGNPWIYMDCSDEEFAEINYASFGKSEINSGTDWLYAETRFNWLAYWHSILLDDFKLPN